MAMVVDASVTSFVQALDAVAKDEVVVALNIKDEIDVLYERLVKMLEFLADAERRRFQDHAVDSWLKQLRDAMYDAEDIIGECRYEGSQRPSSSSSSVRFCSPLSCFSKHGVGHRFGKKIMYLNRRLDAILRDMANLNLTSIPRDHRNSVATTSARKPPLVKYDIVGGRIEDDTSKLVEFLISTEHYKQHKVSVFAILGMGGIGKTTLAKKIYNDEKLRANFSQVSAIWVCVSQDLSQIALLRDIIAQAGGNPGEAKAKEELQSMLTETIKGKKFFLVLDDVCDDKVWEDLLFKPLQSGLDGSRILVTTRHEAIARRIGAVHFHRAERLSGEDGWLLLRNMAFVDDGDAREVRNSVSDTGMRIVEKCEGIPLALKAIAGVLRTKGATQSDWEEIHRNPVWSWTRLPEGVVRAVLLSYIELPSHLKQCFLYFALFPKGAEFFRNRIVHLWIAEGFVESTGNWLEEELAEAYWNELVHRSLLQPNPTSYDSQSCTMHDMFHSLARHVASEECFYKDIQECNGETKSSFSSSTNPRRLHIENGGQAISDVIRKHASLRALISPRIVKFPQDVIAKLRCLRILNLELSAIGQLPSSIGDLIHLRYLNLSNSTITELPESIGNLRSLQFLNTYGCRKLQALPKCIINMSHLRYINVYGTHVQSMPAGIGRLQRLVFLNGFTVSSAEEEHRSRQQRSNGNCNLEELGSLSQLQYLYVYKLERATSREEARAASLNSKTHLKSLWLCCTPSDPDVHYEKEAIKRIEQVFEEFRPPSCLDYLKIGDYFGLEYPSWMKVMPASFLRNLRRMDLVNCILCVQLPPLGLLPQLEHLRIRGASAVTYIGPELFGLGSDARRSHSSFPKLKELVFQNMLNWQEWQWSRKEDHQMSNVLPCLQLLILEMCPKLKSLPKRLLAHATSLKELQIKGAHSLPKVKSLLAVEILDLEDNPILQKVSNLPCLKKLRVTVCGQLRTVEKVAALHTINLRDPNMGSLPDWLLARRELQLRSLHKLEIRANNQLLSRCIVKDADWDKIRHIPRVDAYNVYDESTYIHYTKSPFSFETNLPNKDIARSK